MEILLNVQKKIRISQNNVQNQKKKDKNLNNFGKITTQTKHTQLLKQHKDNDIYINNQ
jgi:hypothetical protein